MRAKLKYWLLGLQAIFVLVLAAVSSRPIPFEFSRPIGAAMMIWTVGAWYFVLRIPLLAMRQERPLIATITGYKNEWRTLVRALEWAVILGLAIALHGWAKSMIPHVTTYWADPLLADADALIFGQDPWHLFRSELLRPVYAQAYVSWFVITFGCMGLLAFSKRDYSLLFNSYLATLILGGTIGQFILPSVGPIFYERAGFGPRFAELVATNDPTYGLFADYLWKYYESGGANLGTGISAMPSMHVTLAVWTVFAARAIWKPLAVLIALYAFIIWCASIASGWHYALDGILGVGIAIGAYRLCAGFEKRQRRLPFIEPLPSPAI